MEFVKKKTTLERNTPVLQTHSLKSAHVFARDVRLLLFKSIFIKLTVGAAIAQSV